MAHIKINNNFKFKTSNGVEDIQPYLTIRSLMSDESLSVVNNVITSNNTFESLIIQQIIDISKDNNNNFIYPQIKLDKIKISKNELYEACVPIVIKKLEENGLSADNLLFKNSEWIDNENNPIPLERKIRVYMTFEQSSDIAEQYPELNQQLKIDNVPIIKKLQGKILYMITLAEEYKALLGQFNCKFDYR